MNLSDTKLFLSLQEKCIAKIKIVSKELSDTHPDIFPNREYDWNVLFENGRIGCTPDYKGGNNNIYNIFIGFDFTLANSEPDYVFCLAVKKDIISNQSELKEPSKYAFNGETFSLSTDDSDRILYFDGKWLYRKIDKELLSQPDDKLTSKIKSVLEDLKLLQKTQNETKGAN